MPRNCSVALFCSGQERRDAWPGSTTALSDAPCVSVYCLVVCFKALNWCSSLLARGVGSLLLYRGCRCLSGCVFLIRGGFRNRRGDLECRARSPGTAELSQLRTLGCCHCSLARSLALPPLPRLTLCFPFNRRTNETLPTSTKSSPGSRWSSRPRTNSSS